MIDRMERFTTSTAIHSVQNKQLFLLMLLLFFISSDKKNGGLIAANELLSDNDKEFGVPERPEGITNGPGTTLLISQILSGSVLSIDVSNVTAAATGTAATDPVLPVVIVDDQTMNNRQAWGLEYYTDATNDNDGGYVLVAGGGPNYGGGNPAVYVYRISTGEMILSCSPLSVNATGYGAFINDVTMVDNELAFITDSFGSNLMIMNVPLSIEQAICNVSEMALPGTEFTPTSSEDWGANGIVSYTIMPDADTTITNTTPGTTTTEVQSFVLVAHEIDGSVYALQNLHQVIGPTTTGTDVQPIFDEIIPAGEVIGADGLTIAGDTLYVTQNSQNMISVYQLTTTTSTAGTDDDAVVITATRIGNLTSNYFDTPATSAILGNYIYSTNSRFYTLPDIGTPANNSIVGIPNPYYMYNNNDNNNMEKEEEGGGGGEPTGDNNEPQEEGEGDGDGDSSTGASGVVLTKLLFSFISMMMTLMMGTWISF